MLWTNSLCDELLLLSQGPRLLLFLLPLLSFLSPPLPTGADEKDSSLAERQ